MHQKITVISSDLFILTMLFNFTLKKRHFSFFLNSCLRFIWGQLSLFKVHFAGLGGCYGSSCCLILVQLQRIQTWLRFMSVIAVMWINAQTENWVQTCEECVSRKLQITCRQFDNKITFKIFCSSGSRKRHAWTVSASPLPLNHNVARQ